MKQQVFDCSVRAKAETDRALNETYQALIQRIRTHYSGDRALADQYLLHLRASQRAWVALRDTNYALEAFEIENGSQAHETTVDGCVIHMSHNRTRYLEQLSPAW
ncbi:lysozyme inhibitor LprI family protein [Pseudomonas indica]|uniref:lysozyme inhibitor LprI family protein n=1 Tax=Pseudomonas indica TaxID=137658 RepID=UPI000A046918|nr:lysozyme inhibitor LprI family protein [Pseudomonas indica]